MAAMVERPPLSSALVTPGLVTTTRTLAHMAGYLTEMGSLCVPGVLQDEQQAELLL